MGVPSEKCEQGLLTARRGLQRAMEHLDIETYPHFLAEMEWMEDKIVEIHDDMFSRRQESGEWR